MSFLDDVENKLDKLDEVMLSIDGIEIVITDIGKQTLLDYINFQSIKKSGIVYAPDDDDILQIIKWFSDRKCTIDLRCSKDKKYSFIERMYIKYHAFKLKRELKKKNIIGDVC